VIGGTTATYKEIPYEWLLQENHPSAPVTCVDPKEDVFVILYSSGTTRKPKGVMESQYSMISVVLQLL